MGRWLSLGALILAAAIIAPSCATSGSCRYNSDCTNSYCADGECKRDCVDAKIDCPRGYECSSIAKCELPLDGGLPDGASVGRDADSDQEAPTEDVVVQIDSNPVTDAAEANVGKAELESCSQDGECRSGLLCRPPFIGSARRCTRACTMTSQCQNGTRCLSINSEQYCASSDIGRACSGSATCNFGCLTGPGYCTAPCVDGADCPNGYGCMPVANQRVCVKAEAPCDVNQTEACIVQAACDTQMSLVSSCTLACNSAIDCPVRAAGLPPWTCDGLCRRPAEVYGGLGQGVHAEYACNQSQTVVNVCNDGLHINFAQFAVPSPPSVNCASPMTTPGAAGDQCVDSCRFRGGCVHGYACVAVGSIAGGRVGLCLPSLGAGEVGATCSIDADCFFGYCNQSKCTRDCSSDGLCPSGFTCNAAGGPLVEGLAFRRCE